MVASNERIMGAVIGSFMGDALALGSHWHYDLAKRDAELYPGGIQGFDRPVAGHYHEGREPGELTHYGDAAMVLLLSLVRNQAFDPKAYAEEFVAYFNLYAGYLDKATKAALVNAEAGTALPAIGGSDTQTGGLSRNGLVALICNGERLEAAMTQACQITQIGEDARACHRFHGHTLHALLAGIPFEEAFAEAADRTDHPFVQQALDQAQAEVGATIVDATGEFGRACNLQSTLPACLQAVLRSGSDPRGCLFEVVRAGGDNASRAMVVGAWLGAAHGLSGLPGDWVARMTQRDEILVLADRLTALAR